MARATWVIIACALAAVGLASGCASPDPPPSDGSSAQGGGASSSTSGGASSSTSGGGGWQQWDGSAGASSSGSSSSSGGFDAGLPPEVEKDLDLGAPEASKNFVFVPVTGADHVVKVSGKTLSVALIEVGDRPTVLATIPGEDAALVINSGSDDISLIRATDAEDTVITLPALPNSNALKVGPDGKHAVCWYDHGRAKSGDPVGSFQAVTVLDLTGDGAAFDVSVGFRPSDVVFTGEGKKAHVVTDDGISILDFATLKAGAIVAPVAVSPDPLDKGKGREVQITPDGRWAVIRQPGLTAVRAVYLATKQLVTISLPAPPSDLDLLPDGSAAIIVLRDTKQVGRVELPNGATPTLAAKLAPTGELVAGLARITSDGLSAVLYSSLAGQELVGTLDTQTLKIVTVAIRKTVDQVFLPPGSRKAVLVHRPADGPNHSDSTEAFVDDAHGYTFFDLDTGFTKLTLTDVASTSFALVDSPARLYMLLPDPKGIAHAVHAADLGTLLGTNTPLGSKPLHVRYLPSAKAVAVAQDHTSGRMTFLPVDGSEAKTVTGYELNARVK